METPELELPPYVGHDTWAAYLIDEDWEPLGPALFHDHYCLQ